MSDIVTEDEFNPELRQQTDKWAEGVTGAIDADIYTGMMCEASFTEVQIVDKVNADSVIERQPGLLRVFSARITGRKV
jgi:hypothetical protein